MWGTGHLPSSRREVRLELDHSYPLPLSSPTRGEDGRPGSHIIFPFLNPMWTLLKLLVIRDLAHHRVRTVLTVIGVALGVSIYVAMRTANLEIIRSFEASASSVTGHATFQIAGGERGFDETLIANVARTLGVIEATPVLEIPGMLLGDDDHVIESLLILGVDVLDQARFWGYTGDWDSSALGNILAVDAVTVSGEFARRNDLEIGSRLRLLVDTEVKTVVIRGFFEDKPDQVSSASDTDGLAVMDIASAQYTFNRLGRLDRIGVVIDPDALLQDVQQRLQRLVPPDVTVQATNVRVAQVERLTRAFRVNLTVLSSVALMVGLFLVYNTVTFSVIQRRRDIGILRSLGMTRRRLMGLFVTESLCLGVLGGILGVALGLLMAKSVLYTVSATVTALYTPVDVWSLQVPPAVIPQGIGVAILVAVLATIGPVRAAGQLSPVDALAPRAVDINADRSRRWIPGLGGLVCLVGAWAFTLPDAVDSIPLFGYGAMLLLLLGCASFMPVALSAIYWVARVLGRRGKNIVWGMMAAARLHHNAGRSTITMSALMVGLAITIGVGVMIHSFRYTVEHWINQTIVADLVVAPTTWFLHGSQGLAGTYGTAGDAGGRMSGDLVDQAMLIDGIDAVDGYREVGSTYEGYPFVVVSRDLVLHAARSQYLMLDDDGPNALPRAATRGEVLISEAFWRRFNIGSGEHVTLKTPSGPVEFRVAGVFYDYATDGGKVVMDHTLYERYWQDSTVNVLAIYLTPHTDPGDVRSSFMATLGRTHHLTVLDNQGLKQRILDIFDRTFAVTYALELIAVLVALLGITNALLASILERRRELAILRSIGGNSSHVRRIFLWESAYLGIIGTVFGTLAGLSLAAVLTQVVNMQSFGWSIQLQFPPLFIGGAMILTCAVSLAAGYVPARVASRLPLTRELQYE